MRGKSGVFYPPNKCLTLDGRSLWLYYARIEPCGVRGKNMLKGIGWAELHELIHYEPELGLLTWKVQRGFKAAGSPIISEKVCIDGKRYPIGEIAFLWYYRRYPYKAFHHINGDPLDIRLSNLSDKRQKVAPKLYLAAPDVCIRISVTAAGLYRLQLVRKRQKPEELGEFSTFAEAAEIGEAAL